MTTFALVGASDFNVAHFADRASAHAFDAVIAVDGGFASLEAAGCVPDLALGDFDSLGYVPEGVPVKAFPAEKDASDMELALEEALARGADAVEVYGALGGRLDHTLANLLLLASFAERGLTVTAVGERERVTFLVGPGELTVAGDEAGAIVSVFSLSDVATGVCEEGLKYGLDHVALTNRTSWGLSNELAGTAARISVESGTLAVFLPL
ncbi:thiamine diphosphokinase [uncultured Adlercreutzia sp.]|uniref:thiamine diphosphokinase n=1 Tax=uncultured Adlercreutzia sp. TaxID=875803 RepID=UPI0026745678|nr:thiamine diphosphokinase [uncultured Adlercreutzia sp.]